jgi:hypothetical protein
MSEMLGRNQWSMVPRVQDLDSSPRAFRQEGGRSRQEDGRIGLHMVL